MTPRSVWPTNAQRGTLLGISRAVQFAIDVMSLRRRRVHTTWGGVPLGRGDSGWDSGMSARLRRQCATHVILLWRWSMRERTPSLREGSEDHPPAG